MDSLHRKRNSTTRSGPDLRLPPSRPTGPALAAGLSLFIHAVLLVMLMWGARRLWVSLPLPGDSTAVAGAAGGGGGGRVAYITLPPAPAAKSPAPPPRKPVVLAPKSEPPKPTSVPDPVPPVPAAATPEAAVDSGAESGATGAGGGVGSGQGIGQGAGAGAGTGAGSAVGPGAGGEGGRITPPEPRQLVLPPPEYPKELRGRTLEVTFWVGVRGEVEHVRVVPPIEHRGFAKKFEETMRNYRFRPARSPDGLPVAGTITVKVAFFQ